MTPKRKAEYAILIERAKATLEAPIPAEVPRHALVVMDDYVRAIRTLARDLLSALEQVERERDQAIRVANHNADSCRRAEEEVARLRERAEEMRYDWIDQEERAECE